MSLNFSKINNIVIKKKNPASLVHFVTNRCNARCSFCFIDFDNPDTFKHELTLDQISELTKNLGKDIVNVNFTGGEPFARKDLFDIAKLYISNSNIDSIYITTNGSLPGRVEEFIKNVISLKQDIELSFQISLDALPEKHNEVRKIKDLYSSCIKTYNLIKNFNLSNVSSTVGITVSEENCENIEQIYLYFKNKENINNIKCILVRDEGVYKTPENIKKKIFIAYNWLTNKIIEDQKSDNIKNYNTNSFQGKIHNKKDEICYSNIKKIYKNNTYISPCHASSLFGVIMPNGDVFPCEILKHDKIGNLKDYNMNFMKLWNSYENKQIKNKILSSKCKCTYECGMSFNIAGNYRYYPQLIGSLLKN